MKYEDKSTKSERNMWISTANKFSKFQAKSLNRSKNIVKSL